MGFNLNSGNSALPFKEMGASPAKNISPSKFDIGSVMGKGGGEGGGEGGGGGGSSKDEPVKPPTIQGAQI